MESMHIVFTLPLFGGIPISESVVMTWGIMAVLFLCAMLVTRNLKLVPTGSQALVETLVSFLNNFQKSLLGHHWKTYAPYFGTIALFLLFANTIGVLGLAPFGLRPPTRDLSVTAALALMTIFLVIGSSIRVRGVKGWFKHLFQPVPFMVFFNLLDYITRPLSLAMRLFGNIFAGYVVMHMVEEVIYLHFGFSVLFSMYFDIFDGILQAVVFVFLSTLYLHEAIE